MDEKEKFIKREIYIDLKNHLKEKEITFLIGPRQAGKTTLIMKLKKYLENKGEKTLYFNLDIEEDFKYFKTQKDLIDKIKLLFGNKKAYVFIDEIQRKENAGVFLKGIYDMNLPYKFIITGSGSFELKEKIKESLVGRKKEFFLTTVNFKEFINFKTNYIYKNKLDKFFEIEKTKAFSLFKEYLTFGGYPKVLLSYTKDRKIQTLSEILKSYLEKDIYLLLGIKKTQEIYELEKLLANNIGRIFNFSEVSNDLDISFITLKNYVFYFEKTFLIEKLSPFFTNIKKEIKKMPIFYFIDLGIRNFSLNFFEFKDIKDLGFLFENFVFLILKEKSLKMFFELHYWRTKQKAEVDFIIEKGNILIPIEVKYKNFNTPKLSRSFRSFIKKYNPKTAFVINLNLEKSFKFKNTKIIFLPYFKTIFIEKFL